MSKVIVWQTDRQTRNRSEIEGWPKFRPVRDWVTKEKKEKGEKK